MAGITAAGVGSGLDVNSLVTSLMSVERRSLSQIQTTQSGIRAKISAYGSLNSGLTALSDAARKLTQTNIVSSLQATSSSKEQVTATADSTATPGSSSVAVSQLAQVQRLIGPRVTDVTTAVGTGRITIAVGSYNTTDNSFTNKTDTTPIEIEIGTGQNTLEGIRDAINSASTGATASIVNDGQGFRLVLTSTSSGSSNSLKITVDDADGNDNNDETSGATPSANSFDSGNLGGLSFLAYDPTASGEGGGKNLMQIQAAQSAQFTVDGIAISSETNTVSGAVKGVTFNLNQVTTAAVRIDVKQDSTGVGNAVAGFVQAYNNMNNVLKAQGGKDGELSKETMPSAIQRQLRSALRGSLQAYNLSLTDVGLTFDKDGVLNFSSTKFTEALTKDPGIARKIFADTGISSDARVSYLSASSKTNPGTYAVNVTTSSDGTSNALASINGTTAKVTGNILTGAEGNDADGMVLRLVNGNTGSLGSVTFSRGFASSIMKAIDGLISSNGGVVNNRTETLNKQLRSLDLRTEKENMRLGELEKRFRAQYSALDTQLSKMQSTSAYISANLG